MVRSARLTAILEMLSDQGSVTVEELVSKLDISPATARRDLDALASEGRIRRTHGGATAVDSVFEKPALGQVSNAQAKKDIARECLNFVQPGAVIGLSGGSTVSLVAEELVQWAAQHAPQSQPSTLPVLTIVTNAVNIAYALGGNPHLRVVLLGGVMNPASYELTGPFSTKVMGQISLDLAFIGVNGFDENGPGTVDEFEAFTNRAMASRAVRPIVVADATKFGKRSFSSVGGTDVMRTIVTNDSLSPTIAQDLRDKGYTVVIASRSESEMS